MKMRYVDVINNELTICTTDVPKPQAGEVLVKVSHFGLNRADILQKQGKYPPPTGASHVLGLEVAGEVVACGDECHQMHNGKSVAAMLSGGGYAEYVCIPEGHLIFLPEGASKVEFAGIPEVYLTAIQSLVFIAEIQPAHKVLIHAGASGLGCALIQLAKQFQTQVAVTCSANKVEFCQRLGADAVVNYQSNNFVEELKAQRFFPDIIVDVIGGNYLKNNIDIINQDGHIVQLAMMGGRFAEGVDLAKILGKRINIHGSTLRNRDDQYKAKLVDHFNQFVLPKLALGQINPCVEQVFPISEIAAAHQRMQDNLNKGKLVIAWD